MLQPMGLQRIGHNLATEQQQQGSRMTASQKVNSSSGYSFRQHSGYRKNLSCAKSCQPATHRNRAPDTWLYNAIDTICNSCPNLGSESLLNAEEDGCGSMSEGKRLVGYAVTSQTQITEPRDLCPGTLAQKVELTALT